MTINELIKALQRLKLETASIACLGCGHEHNCGIHGCAIIREAVEHISSIQSAFSDGPYGFSHLLDLLRAEKEGRVVVLPCKEGDTVWMYGEDFGTVLPYTIDLISFVGKGCGYSANYNHNGELIDGIDFEDDDIGKTVFLTREEAQRLKSGQSE